MNFEALFVYPNGRTSRAQFVPALITLVAAVAFYAYFVKGRTGQWSMLVLVFPFLVLHARRLHDMGHTAWLLLAPGLLVITTFAIWLRFVDLGAQLNAAVPMAALAVSIGFALWGCMAKGQTDANRFGAPAAA